MSTVRELEQRVAQLERDVLAMLDERRWLLRAVALVALTAVASLVVSLIKAGVG